MLACTFPARDSSTDMAASGPMRSIISLSSTAPSAEVRVGDQFTFPSAHQLTRYDSVPSLRTRLWMPAMCASQPLRAGHLRLDLTTSPYHGLDAAGDSLRFQRFHWGE